MDILLSKTLLFFFFPCEAGQNSITTLAGSPSTYPRGRDPQEDKEKQKPKSHLCLSLHYCPWQSQRENPPEAPWGICNFSIATWICMQAAQFCLRKESLAYLLNRAKWNHVFDKQPCIRNEVAGRKKSNIRKEGQSCHWSTQMNSGNLSVSNPSVKISLCAPDKSLSLCLCFPCVKDWQCLLCLFWQFKT